MKIYTDGSGTNGIISGYCVVAGEDIEHRKFYEPYTSNEAEYLGALRALEIARPGDIILTDSKVVVNQAMGRWKTKEPRLIPLMEKTREISKEKRVSIRWIPREENLAGHIIEDSH